MRYLTFAADYMQPTLRDEDPDVYLDPLQELPAELGAEIIDWNERYQAIVPMDPAARSAAADAIGVLDLRGLELASRIAEALRPSKVRYYSEGLMRYLP